MCQKILLIFLWIFLQSVSPEMSKDNWHESAWKRGLKIIKPNDYLEVVTARMVEILENQGLSGEALPMGEITHAINEAERNFTAIGNVRFHSGFVAAIEEITDLKQSSGLNQDLATVKSRLYYRNVSVVYDIDLSLQEFEGFSRIIIRLPVVNFDFVISRNTTTTQNTAEVTLVEASCKNIGVVAFPYNPSVQLLVRAIRAEKNDPVNPDFCDKLRGVLKTWKLQSHLQQAVDEKGFPEVCYYC